MNTIHYYNQGQWRIARKQHICHQCHKTITKGQRYWEDYNSTPAYQSGHRYHTQCATAPDYIVYTKRYVALADPETNPDSQTN